MSRLAVLLALAQPPTRTSLLKDCVRSVLAIFSELFPFIEILIVLFKHHILLSCYAIWSSEILYKTKYLLQTNSKNSNKTENVFQFQNRNSFALFLLFDLFIGFAISAYQINIKSHHNLLLQ